MGMMRDASVAGPWRAIARAELYYHECGAYPVMVDNPQTVTRGDLYVVDEHSRDWHWLLNMECDAGYTPRWIPIVAEQTDGTMGETMALAFMWEHDHGMLHKVPNGDWLQADWEHWPERR
jgi:gamma-glutamylcyclotransferase (GGCT)/AIG2-like uncharacterized protein YtfP